MTEPVDWTRTAADIAPTLTEHVLLRNGCPIHTWIGPESDRPAVVLLHGAWMDHRMFNAQLPLLVDRYRVLVWDARGQGRSRPLGIDRPAITDYVDDLLAVLDDNGIDRVMVIGQSMGAYLAQHLIRLHPERVSALVVIGATPIARPLSRAERAALDLAVQSFRIWPNLPRAAAKNTALREDVRAYAERSIAALDRRSLVRVYQAVSTSVPRSGFPDFRVEVPFLLTHGDSDVTGTIRRDGPRWAASDPRIDYRVIADAGHNANQDNPEAFNAALLDFLERLG